MTNDLECLHSQLQLQAQRSEQDPDLLALHRPRVDLVEELLDNDPERELVVDQVEQLEDLEVLPVVVCGDSTPMILPELKCKSGHCDLFPRH